MLAAPSLLRAKRPMLRYGLPLPLLIPLGADKRESRPIKGPW